MSRIASLYIPWLDIILENIDRFESVNNIVKSEIQRNLENKACVHNRTSTCFIRQDANYTTSAGTINNISTATSTPVKISHR
jgi:hypothetical protein